MAAWNVENEHGPRALSSTRLTRARAYGLAVAVAIALLASPATSAASEESELAIARGLVELHAGRYANALALFERAAKADPDDLYAHYYEGLALVRLERFAEAETALRSVVAAKPDLNEAGLALGIALVRTGQYREAADWLQKAQAAPDLDAEASLYLGVAQLRLGNAEAAQRNFERAASRDPSFAAAARYYQGVADLGSGSVDRARSHFESVVATSPDTEVGVEAAQYLRLMREGQLWNAARSYDAYGSVGFEYDSNVRLVDTYLTTGGKADGRGVITAGGRYLLWPGERAQVSVGYDFFQSLHFDLTEYNLQDNRPSVQVLADLGRVRVGLLGRYDYYLREDDSFLGEASALPWLVVPAGEYGRTEVFYRFRRRDFKQQAYSHYTGYNQMPGIDQYVYLGSPARYVVAGYQFDYMNPDDSDSPYGYDGHRIRSGIGWDVTDALSANAEYAFFYRTYGVPAPNSRRHDDEHWVVVASDLLLGEHVFVTLGYFGTFNSSYQTSNLDDFSYTRHIVSLSVGGRF